MYVSCAFPPSLMTVLSTDAFKTILVVEASPPPPPLPAGMSKPTTSAPLLLVKVRCTVLSSSLSSALPPKMVLASTSLNFAVTAEFCTGFVLFASRLSSISVSLMVTFTLPVESGVCFVPFTVILLTVPAPPKSSQLEIDSQLERFVPMNCLVSHLPCDTS